MALDLTVTYPGQVAPATAAYPQGEARNRSTPGDSDGTPWEEQIVNDLLGMEQSLLDAAGITPSGAPDEVGASDYLDAMKVLFRGTRRVQALQPIPDNNGTAIIPTDWQFYDNSLAWIAQDENRVMYVPMANIPEHCTLVALRLQCGGDLGPSGPETTLPTSPLSLQLYYTDGSGVLQVPSGVQTGNPVDLAAYNAVHEYVWTLDTPLVIDAAVEQLNLFAYIEGPQGVGFTDGAFGVLRLQCVFAD